MTLNNNFTFHSEQTPLMIPWEDGSTLLTGLLKMLQAHDAKVSE
jgi:hypothetical protein